MGGCSHSDWLHQPQNKGRAEPISRAEGIEISRQVKADDAGDHRPCKCLQIEYDNGILRIAIDGNAGEVYRLYEAALDRTPDLDGLSYWIDERDNGATMTQIANNFILSDEFQELYGDPDTLSNDAFLTLVYQNILNRTPDQAGFAYWTSELERGFGRDALLASFAESDENVANVAPALTQGIFFEFS